MYQWKSLPVYDGLIKSSIANRPLIRSAEVRGERPYENGNTTVYSKALSSMPNMRILADDRNPVTENFSSSTKTYCKRKVLCHLLE